MPQVIPSMLVFLAPSNSSCFLFSCQLHLPVFVVVADVSAVFCLWDYLDPLMMEGSGMTNFHKHHLFRHKISQPHSWPIEVESAFSENNNRVFTYITVWEALIYATSPVVLCFVFLFFSSALCLTKISMCFHIKVGSSL